MAECPVYLYTGAEIKSELHIELKNNKKTAQRTKQTEKQHKYEETDYRNTIVTRYNIQIFIL